MPPRSSTRLKQQIDQIRQGATGGDEAGITSTKYMRPGSIFTIAADHVLRHFPSFLKDQLDEYFKTPGADVRTFAGSRGNFNIKYTLKGELAHFVEFNTSNTMDCALYQTGLSKDALQMLVVQPQQGSSFNDGNPAIIVFHGKITRRDMNIGRKLASRWAIWTPHGLKEDTFVDRLIIGQPTHNSEDTILQSTSKRRKKNTDAVNRHDSHASIPAEAMLGEVSDQLNEEHQPVLIKQEDIWEGLYRRIPPSSPNSGLRNHSLCPERSPPSIIPPLITDAAVKNDDRDTSCVAQQRRIRSLTTPPSTYTTLSNCSRLQSSSNTPNPHPESLMARIHPHISLGKTNTSVQFIFKGAQCSEVRISKTLAQCNSVQKLFAYASKAQISDPTIVLLLASINTRVIALVRDDVDDFEELLKLIVEERESVHAGQVTVVAIVPGTY